MLSVGDYFTPTPTHEHRCYTFHSEDVIRRMGSLGSTRGGRKFGLQLGLKVDQQHYGSGADSAGFTVRR